MPKLSCGVTNCGNNADECCCLGEIDVSGNNAVNPDDTCCSNFGEKSGTTNSTANANPYLSVKCGACNCTHNANHECCAESISISGYGASNSIETACSSFCQG